MSDETKVSWLPPEGMGPWTDTRDGARKSALVRDLPDRDWADPTGDGLRYEAVRHGRLLVVETKAMPAWCPRAGWSVSVEWWHAWSDPMRFAADTLDDGKATAIRVADECYAEVPAPRETENRWLLLVKRD